MEVARLPRLPAPPSLLRKIDQAVRDLGSGNLNHPKATGRAKRRRRRQPAEPKPLTPKQVEVVQLYGECKGDFAEVARRMNLDRKTVVEHYEAAMKKMGKTAVKPTTRSIPADRRGQATLSHDDDQRLL